VRLPPGAAGRASDRGYRPTTGDHGVPGGVGTVTSGSGARARDLLVQPRREPCSPIEVTLVRPSLVEAAHEAQRPDSVETAAGKRIEDAKPLRRELATDRPAVARPRELGAAAGEQRERCDAIDALQATDQLPQLRMDPIEVDPRPEADRYALAATAYHLLTGAQLFPGSNPEAAHTRQRPWHCGCRRHTTMVNHRLCRRGGANIC